MRRKFAAILAVAGFVVAGLSAPAAFGVPPGGPCNAGDGNGSEGGTPSVPFHPGTPDCDPGNSPGNNNAGD